jgi:hypothetical protein
MCIEVHTFKWKHITIEAIYQPNKWDVIAHLEIRSIDPPKAPLPITETGYLSHFHPIGSLEESHESVEEAVLFWLNERARTKAWIEHEARSRQGSLFDML